MEIQLSDHFTFKRLIRFTLPSMIMMVFTSIYGVIDGFFVSNFAGATAFAAVNLIMPVLMIIGAVGFMIGSGGVALVSMTLGMGKEKRAREIFSLLIYVVIAAGITASVLAAIFMPSLAKLLGATEEMLPYCVTYGRICSISMTSFMLQNIFQSFLVTAERPKLGLVITVAAGVTNIILDAVLVGVLGLGIVGAASATVCAELIGGLVPLAFFAYRKNGTTLYLGKTHMDWTVLGKTAANGSSEFMTNISMSIVNMVYNIELMQYAGSQGVAAYGVIMYVAWIFSSIFVGYSVGVSPVIAYHYGAENEAELKNLFRKSAVFVESVGVILVIAAHLAAPVLAGIFVGYDEALYRMTLHGFNIYSCVFLISGLNMFGSALFTALNNGPVSAAISFGRTLVFQLGALLILPRIFGINGIWSAILCAEALALLLTGYCILHFRNRYHYF